MKVVNRILIVKKYWLFLTFIVDIKARTELEEYQYIDDVTVRDFINEVKDLINVLLNL